MTAVAHPGQAADGSGLDITLDGVRVELLGELGCLRGGDTEWVTSARRSDTRARRIAPALAWRRSKTR